MLNSLYETTYTKIIEPIYGEKRNNVQDDNLNAQANNNNNFLICNRTDMTHYDTYTIDPPGCLDADDGFSIYIENDKLFLAIHIADPTHYISPESKLWKDICQRVTTKYPSNRPPIHLMTEKVVHLSSLQSKSSEIKKAITILTEINKDSFLPEKEIKLLFTDICVKSENSFTYSSASQDVNNISSFLYGLKISESLKNKRSKSTKGTKLSDINTAYPIYDNSEANVYLYEDSHNEKRMKEMIAEFAIFANSFVGEYLKIHLNFGIFRTCNANEWLNSVYNEISGKELLQEIITNGIRADYMSKISSHDLVGMPEYCHFTSPIRRLSDCICHYLLKYIYLSKNNNVDIPFNEETLNILANKCVITNKKDKKNQYMDIKFRLLQVMNNMLIKKDKIKIGYYITNYSGLFLNLIISKIDNYNVHMSYCIRIKNYKKTFNSKEIIFLDITTVNVFTKYDENTIPELDKQLKGDINNHENTMFNFSKA